MSTSNDSKELSFKNGTVAVLACLINCLIMGCLRLSSLTFAATLDTFHVTREEAALPFFLVTTVRTATGPLIGYSGRKFGPRLVTICGCFFASIGVGACFFAEGMLLLNICWGGILGLGAGFGTILLPQILSQHFKKHLDKANGLCMAGECLSGFVAPGLFYYTVDKLGLSATFLIISAFVMQSIPASILLKSLTPTKAYEKMPHQNSSKSEKIANNHQKESAVEHKSKLEDSKTIYHSGFDPQTFQNQNSVDIIPFNDLEKDSNQKVNSKNSSLCKSLAIFLEPSFLFIMVTQSMSIFIAISVYTILVDFSRDVGVPPHEEIYPVMVYAIADIIGRFTVGFITDGGYLNRIKFTILSYALIGFLQIIFPFLRGTLSVLIVVFLYAILLGANFTVSSGIVVEFVKKEHLSMAFSTRYILCAPLSLIISPMIGYFREQKGSYEGLLYIIGAIAFCCAILTSLIPVIAKRKKEEI